MDTNNSIVGNELQYLRYRRHLEDVAEEDHGKCAKHYANFTIAQAEPGYLTQAQEQDIDRRFCARLGLHAGQADDDDVPPCDTDDRRPRVSIRPTSLPPPRPSKAKTLRERVSGGWTSAKAVLRSVVGRNTNQPVRAQSKWKGEERNGFWQPVEKKWLARLRRAALLFECRNKAPGRKSGPLGRAAITILQKLFDFLDVKSGRLDPSLNTLAKETGCCKDTVVRALHALREHGFIAWMRRCVETGNDGKGPQVQQTSNAYKLMLPPAAEALLPKPAPAPVDAEHAAERRAADREEMERRMRKRAYALMEFGDTALGRASGRLGELIDSASLMNRLNRGESS